MPDTPAPEFGKSPVEVYYFICDMSVRLLGRARASVEHRAKGNARRGRPAKGDEPAAIREQACRLLEECQAWDLPTPPLLLRVIRTLDASDDSGSATGNAADWKKAVEEEIIGGAGITLENGEFCGPHFHAKTEAVAKAAKRNESTIRRWRATSAYQAAVMGAVLEKNVHVEVPLYERLQLGGGT